MRTFHHGLDSRVYCASVTRHNTLDRVDTHDDDRRCVLPGSRVLETDARRVSIVTLDWSKITGGYDTADNVATDRKTKDVMK